MKMVKVKNNTNIKSKLRRGLASLASGIKMTFSYYNFMPESKSSSFMEVKTLSDFNMFYIWSSSPWTIGLNEWIPSEKEKKKKNRPINDPDFRI